MLKFMDDGMIRTKRRARGMMEKIAALNFKSRNMVSLMQLPFPGYCPCTTPLSISHTIKPMTNQVDIALRYIDALFLTIPTGMRQKYSFLSFANEEGCYLGTLP